MARTAVAPRLSGVVIALLVGGLLASGCLDSKYRYIKNGDDKTYFKIPKEWHFYDHKELLKASSSEMSEEQQQAQLDAGWNVAFDASPKRSLAHVGNYAAKYPEGLAVVQGLSDSDADSLSLAALSNVFQVQTAVENGQGQLLAYEHITRDGGFRGVHLVAQLQVGAKVAQVDQTILVNQASTKVHALIVSCTTACFERYQSDIDQVIESWTVKAG